MDLRDQVQRALGDAYVLERELGGGGMSRVFVARDVALERDVVLKVLAPELAEGLSADRFTREIRLTAALQEPHIVPVLAAGVTAEGLPYYSMPFVRGESLRARMDSGKLPLDEALSVLRDVATALEYAHAHGVVHRDIKPENILRSGRTAVVTDFGIAKALSASKATSAGTLTAVGTSLGTPAYMAPEQVSGDDADARADIYSWGVLAYELLAGRHPFAASTTAQQLMAAHIAEVPAPLDGVAPNVPAPIAALVMRALAKNPAGRPAHAGDLVAALTVPGVSATQGVGRRRWTWRRTAAVTVLALVVLTIGGWLLVPTTLRATLRTLVTRAPANFVVNRVVVAPFTDESRDPRLAALGQLIADNLTTGLSRLASLELVDSRTAMVSGEIVRRIPRLFRSNDERALGEESGAKVVVAGRYYVVGDSLYVSVTVLDAETGRMRLAIAPVAGAASAPQAVVAVVTSRVVAALRAASDKELASIQLSAPPSLEAFAAFRQAMTVFLAGERTAPDSALFNPLARAHALDPTWPTPLLTAAFVAYRRWEFARADSALAAVASLRDRLAAPDAEALDAIEALARSDVRAAFAAARGARIPLVSPRIALTARRPRAAMTLLAIEGPDRGLNLALSNDYWGILSLAWIQLGDYDRAESAAHESVRRNARPNDLAEFLDVVSASRGDVDAVRTALQSRLHAGTLNPHWAAFLTTLLRGRGKRDAEGLALMASVSPELLGHISPDSVSSCAAACWVLASTEQWAEVLRQLDATAVRAGAILRTVPEGEAYYTRKMRDAYRAVALVHLGRSAEARAIDSALVRTMGARWDMGVSALACAIIAAHAGETDRALALLERALNEGVIGWWRLDWRKFGIDGDPFLLPLRADPRFRALLRPDPADGT